MHEAARCCWSVRGKYMRKEFGVKITASNGGVSWIVFNNRYGFTKSKATALLDSVVNRGLFSGSKMSVQEL